MSHTPPLGGAAEGEGDVLVAAAKSDVDRHAPSPPDGEHPEEHRAEARRPDDRQSAADDQDRYRRHVGDHAERLGEESGGWRTSRSAADATEVHERLFVDRARMAATVAILVVVLPSRLSPYLRAQIRWRSMPLRIQRHSAGRTSGSVASDDFRDGWSPSAKGESHSIE
ncbi:hypothetical protein [Amycolatopsis japonica]